MAIVRTDDKHYKAIADKLRSYGYTDTATPEEMPHFIESVVENECIAARQRGKDEGYSDGRTDGYNDGMSQGYYSGKQAQYDEFWEGYCNTINTSYTGGFGAFSGPSWNKENCKPTKDLKPKYAYQMFAYNTCIEDLDEWAEECGITIDFSESTTFIYTFYGSTSTLKSVGVIDTTNANSCSNTFYGASGLHTIKNLILKEDGSQSFASIFKGNVSLTNITISGKIGGPGFDVKECPLTHDSLMSIIYALFDHSTTGYARTVTLGTDNKNKLTEAEIAIATQKGWSVI